jgi:hypothetical protein
MTKLFLLVSTILLSITLNAQEKYGRTVNGGAGLTFARYSNFPIPAINFNSEFDLVQNVTLAPSISFLRYNDYGTGYLGQEYKYRTTVIPIGVKSYYYFDELLELDGKFDVYAGIAAGINLAFGKWENGYNGLDYAPSYNAIYVDLHVGGEYHFKEDMGVYVDLSSGLSTIGLAFHL